MSSDSDKIQQLYLAQRRRLIPSTDSRLESLRVAIANESIAPDTVLPLSGSASTSASELTISQNYADHLIEHNFIVRGTDGYRTNFLQRHIAETNTRLSTIETLAALRAAELPNSSYQLDLQALTEISQRHLTSESYVLLALDVAAFSLRIVAAAEQAWLIDDYAAINSVGHAYAWACAADKEVLEDIPSILELIVRNIINGNGAEAAVLFTKLRDTKRVFTISEGGQLTNHM